MAQPSKVFPDASHRTMLRPADVEINGAPAKIALNGSVAPALDSGFVHTFRVCPIDSATGTDDRADLGSIVFASRDTAAAEVDKSGVHRLFGYSDPTLADSRLTPADDTRGCEDAGVVQLGNAHLIFYSALPDEDFDTRKGEAPNTRVAMAVSFDNLETVVKLGVVGPDLKSRGGFLFPEVIDGCLYFGCAVHRVYGEMIPVLMPVAVASPDSALETVDDAIRLAAALREASLEMTKYVQARWSGEPSADDFGEFRFEVGPFGARVGYETGPGPVKIDNRWLMVVNEIQDENFGDREGIWRPKLVALASDDPRRVTDVSKWPAFWAPPDSSGLEHRRSSAMFSKGLAVDGPDVVVTYGFADTTCCSAVATIDQVMGSLVPVGQMPGYQQSVPSYFDTGLPGEPAFDERKAEALEF